VYSKTKRSANIIDDAMRIANQLFDRSSLNAGKKDVKIVMDKQGTAGTNSSIPKKVWAQFNVYFIRYRQGLSCLKKRKKRKSRSYSPEMKTKKRKRRHVSLEHQKKTKNKSSNVIASRICSDLFAVLPLSF
jgi:hypothetical protein